MSATREQQLKAALFRGSHLHPQNSCYLREFRTLTESLLRIDLSPKDLTVEALDIKSQPCVATVLARESGVAAGLEELALLGAPHGVAAQLAKKDGDTFQAGETLLRVSGERNKLLSLERVGLNLLQRMCGIATQTRALQNRVRSRCATTHVVATRKTLWGLLDKRAVHWGGGGTHRLGLGDAILIKNNHLALIAAREEDAVPQALAHAWKYRKQAAFVEVEVRSQEAALSAARTFERLQQDSGERYPCLLLLDNFPPEQIHPILDALRRGRLLEYVLIEASGGISESNIEAYADTEVDAISVGALTHSARALDICQRIS
jgi:nicotinate-nucleotide pyrophosphorylase (carboxylating)